MDQSVSGSDFSPGFGSASVPVRNRGIANPEVKRGFNSGTLSSSGFHKVVTSGGIPAAQDSQLSSRMTATSKVITSMNSSVSTSTSSTSRSIEKPSPDSTVPGYAYEKVSLQRITKGHTDNKDLHPSIIRQDAASFASHSKRQLQKDGDASANVDKSIPIDKKNARKGSNGEEESTDSENDPEPISSFHRKLSTNKDIKNTASLKEGYLMKQTSSFQRWHRRYFKVKGRTLYYGKDDKAQIFDEIGLTELTIADSSSKHFKHCFQVITPYRVLVLAADDRTAMEEWIHAIRAASNANFYETGDHSCLLSGAHVWYATSHARPTYCNICKEQLCGVTSHGLSCEICKFKAHKRCASKALNNCKWTTLASMGKDIVEEADGSLALPHQWLEGNLPVSAKCDVCEKTCGSVLRLQDWRCLWCRASVHTACRPVIGSKCPLGRISVVPPTALHTIGSDDAWEASRPLLGCSPLLVFVNSKSGDHQGLKFLRRFKQLLNPAQVFDLMNGGPRLGLQLFRHYEPFRILVCGGDGSVGWVMSEIDRLDMHRQCQVGVLPLGTGNDLARVLGWGAACDDDAHLPHLLEKYEKATTKMLDRWSIMTFERGVFLKPTFSEGLRLNQKPQISQYEDSVVSHLQNILQSNQHQTVISSAKVLCETVRDMIGKIGTSACDSEIDEKCATLSQKLDSLLQTLHEETENEPSTPESEDQDLIEEADMGLKTPPTQVSGLSSSVTAGMSHSPTVKKMTKFRQREALMSRANSLKKAVRQIIEHAEKTIDEQNTSPPVVIVRPMSLSVAHDPPQQRVEPMKYEQDLEDSEDRVDVDFDNSLDVESAEGSPQHEDVCDKQDDETSPLLPNDLCISPIDPHVTLPVPTQFADQNNASFRIRNFIDEAQRSFEGEGDQDEEPVIQIHNNTFKCDSDDEKENKVQLDHDQSEKDKDDEEELLSERSQLEKSSIAFPKIEVESPSSSSIKTPEDSEEFSISENYSLLNPHIKADSGTSSITISSTTAPNQGNSGESSFLSVPGSGGNFPRGASPRASRRISMGSLFKPLEVEIPKSPKSPKNPLNFFGDSSEGNSYSSAANSPFSSSAHSSPNKMSSSSSAHHKRKTLPIVNPLVSHPSWPAIAAGGVVSKVLLANADAICAVASPLMDPEMDPEELMIGFDERCVMNNYFGIGIDAKITLDFHLKREEHPKKCSSRTKNFMWYGVLGSKEFLQKSCKNLEQRVQLECDGKRLPLPSLQGIVILNIQSFMGGTNFWGGTKEDDCFLAPSFDDKILEVVAVFDSMQMAASRLINLQHHRIAQCHQIKITILGDEPIPVQVDGEAWLQPPGVIRIIHKNRMQMLCRNRALESSLKAWEEKQKHLVLSPSPTDNEELEKKRHSKGLFKIKFRREKPGDDTEGPSEFSDGYSEEAGSSDARSVEKWTGAEVGEWLEHLQLGEYRGHFFRHDIRGAELLSLQRRDLKELGVTKIGHLKRILQGIDNLQKELSISTANNKEVE